MSLDRVISLLQDHPVFEALDREALRLLAFASDRLELAAGTRLFAQGTPADSGYILIRGELDMEQNRNGQIESVGLVPEGALIGELALLTQTTRPATAVARTAIEVVKIPRNAFRRTLEEYPHCADILRQRLTERLLDLGRSLDTVRARMLRDLPEEQ